MNPACTEFEPELSAYLDRARASGLAITHDQYAYSASMSCEMPVLEAV